MRLVLLYGPPATGKLTIAKHLARMSGYQLFDNHASIDLANRIFARDEAGFGDLVTGIRKLVFETAARNDKNLIFTYVYAHPQDKADMVWMINSIENNGGQVRLVHLSCDPDILLQRVSDDSRRAYSKITDEALLTEILGNYDVLSAYPDRPSLSLNTSRMSAEEIAAKILLELSLTFKSDVRG